MVIESSLTISVVTPTLGRPQEVADLVENLSRQTVLPGELILVDGAPAGEDETQWIVEKISDKAPFLVRYLRHSGGTAIQRNVGIEAAVGDYVAFIDDDIRLEPDFFERILEVFEQDSAGEVGAVVGYITNQYLDPDTSPRWRWYRRLKLFTTYEPGKYDYQSGYPINRYLQPPHEGIREVDVTGAGSVTWRSEVLNSGLRFDPFFAGYGILEDAHFCLRARKNWKLLECGRARCVHLHSPGGRENSRSVTRKTAVNYRYVFVDIVPKRTWMQEFRFWRVQVLDLVRLLAVALRHPGKAEWSAVLGKIEGIWAANQLVLGKPIN